MKARRAVPGFSLVELLLALMILSVLWSVTIPAYQDSTLKARAAESVTLSDPVREQVARYYAHRGRFPADNREAGLLEPRQIRGRNVESVQVEDGAVHVRFASGILGGTLLSFRPLVSRAYPSGDLIWSCGDFTVEGFEPAGRDLTDIDGKYVPTCNR